MDAGLQTALTFLAYTCSILAIAIFVLAFLVYKDLTEVLAAYRELAKTIQKEIDPTLEELKKALESINALTSGVNKQITAVKSSFGSAYNLAFNTVNKFKGASAAVLGGLLAGFKLFSKFKK